VQANSICIKERDIQAAEGSGFCDGPASSSPLRKLLVWNRKAIQL